MKIDLYTRAVLTVIASCLVYFVVRDVAIVPDAHASNGVVDVNIVQISGSLLNSAVPPPLAVRIVK